MESTRLSPRVLWLITAILTVSGVILRSVCMLTAFDATVGYFNKGVLPALSAALYFAAVAAAVIGAAHTVPIHMKPGGLFDEAMAEAFSVPNRVIIRPGETITL